jgi:hypothetical protein
METLRTSPEALIDVAYRAFEAKRAEFKVYESQDISESDTRSKIIDPILGILGWREQSIQREWHERTDGKYLDYKLATTHPVFVIEAKKQYVHFEIPPGGVRFYRIDGAIKKAKNLLGAIIQAREYAINSGILYCCVTNGVQFVFFRSTNNLGVHWDQQLVLVFRDHADIASRFSEFYEAFSFESVSSGRSNSQILVNHTSANETSRFHRFLAELNVSNETRDRNALFPYTRELIKRVFQGLDNDDVSPELLEHCYVESARDSSYERGIGEMLKEHRTKIPNGSTRLVTKKKDAGEFQAQFERLADTPTQFGSVTLLIGTVGAGKTTFINRFRKVFARQLIDEHFVWIQVSFTLFVESHDELAAWVHNNIKAALKEYSTDINPFSWEAMQEIYSDEIKELKDGFLKPYFLNDKAQYECKLAEALHVFSDRSDAHLLRCLDYYSKRSGRQVILIFDNADQHTASLQNEVFLLAHKFSQILRCVAFISLREESYWKNKEFGGLSAFHPTSFQITSPRIEQVMARRFRYAIKMIDEDKQSVAEHFVVSQLDLSPTQIGNIFKTFQNTLLGEDKRFVRFLEYISPGEVRRSLDFVARFLTSGHTNVNRIMDRSARGMAQPVGFYEFLQAVMLGDRAHYSEAHSDVINVFATDGKGDRSHFNRVAIIARVLSAVAGTSSLGKGLISVSEVVHDCEELGISAETSVSIIGMLVQKRILATDTLIREEFNDGSYIRATSAALYYVTELAPYFTYIDNVIVDTEIGRDDVRQSLCDFSRQILAEQDRFRRLELRIERTRQFVMYLRDEYEGSTLSRAGIKFDPSAKGLVKTIVDGYSAQSGQIITTARVAFNRPAADLLQKPNASTTVGLANSPST